jgi:hypothetical protein
MVDHEMSLTAFIGNIVEINKLQYKLFTDAPSRYSMAGAVIGIAAIIYNNASMITRQAAATDGNI